MFQQPQNKYNKTFYTNSSEADKQKIIEYLEKRFKYTNINIKLA